jgi:hypothetical protein
VLLACLTVKECQVTDICNLERTFVLTGPTLRYWIPEIKRLGDAIERFCCPSPCDYESDSGSRSNELTPTGAETGDAIWSRFAGVILELRAAACGTKVRSDTNKWQIASPLDERRQAAIEAFLRTMGPQVPTAGETQGMAARAVAAPEAEPAESLADKLRISQHLNQLSRDHHSLAQRLAKLEKAAKKGAIPDA